MVSTDIPEVRVLDDCLVGTNHQDFIDKVEKAVTQPKARLAVSDAIRHESWEAKVDKLRAILEATPRTKRDI